MSTEEETDLDEERKQEILAFESKLLFANHFEMLGVAASATAEECKQAFHALSRRFHPDRFYGKKLGSFKGRIDKIYKRMVEASSTLSDPAKREAYLEANSGLRVAAAPSTPQARTPAEEVRDAERRARLARHPYLSRANKVHESIARAKAHVAKNEFSHAFTQLNLAAQIDPNNAEVKALLAEVRRKNDSDRSATELQRANEALERGDETTAVKSLKSAVTADAHNWEAAFKLAQLLDKHNADLKESSAYAQKAVEAAPNNVEARLLLGRLLDVAGMKVLAKKHYEEAERLSPDHPEVKKALKRRWPF